MKAMILAAGLGTRLQPLTNDRPKALVEVEGRALLEITLSRLRNFGIREVIVNVHHFADMVVDYLKVRNNFGMQIEISREDELLDTGGGLRKAADFFLRDSASGKSDSGNSDVEPFLLHNVDVLSSIELGKMVEFHRGHGALATVAVQQRSSSRCLLFDAQNSTEPSAAPMQLCGRRTAGKPDEIVRLAPQLQPWAFTGIHVLSPRIFALINAGPPQAFSIIPEYLRLAGKGEKILGFPADGYYWRDLGTLASLDQAAADMQQNLVSR